ncbi:hypothetical protein GN956_G27175, partial [Arapaima gigas]
MVPGLVRLSVLLLWELGVGVASDVTQEPAVLHTPKGNNTELKCSHTKGISYYQMYWYLQRPGENMQLVVFTSVGLEPEFGNFDKTKYEVVKKEAAHGSLTVKNAQAEDGGVYFCA